MTKTLIVFPEGYTVNNSFFNDAKAGDEYSLKPIVIDCSNESYSSKEEFDEDVKDQLITYEDWVGKWDISAILFEMVKDEEKILHTGMRREDTEEAKAKQIEDERLAAIAARAAARKAKRQPKPPVTKS